jgi:chitosanase
MGDTCTCGCQKGLGRPVYVECIAIKSMRLACADWAWWCLAVAWLTTVRPAVRAGEPALLRDSRAPGLFAPVKKEIAMQLVSSAENSSLDWKAQYGYLEYNVEKNEKENRGYTGGIIGFTSRTHDMLELVRYYQTLAPSNGLTRFVAALEKVDGTASRAGLGKPFEQAWRAAAKDLKFREAQDHERDRVYFEPAVRQARADGLRELGQFAYYDAMVMHGGGDGRNSFGGIRRAALKKAKPPFQGGDEAAYLEAFLDARRQAMLAEQGHQDTSRVDTMQRKFLREGNLRLELPLEFKVYGDRYRIERVAVSP